MEGPQLEKKDSAEQRYLIDKLDPEMRAAKFLLDPQEYINQYHDYLQSSHPDESKHAVLAIHEIYELGKVIDQPDVTETDSSEKAVYRSGFTRIHPELEVFISGGEYDPTSITMLLTWLNAAGFTKEQVQMWVDLESDGLDPPIEQLEERSVRVIFNNFYVGE